MIASLVGKVISPLMIYVVLGMGVSLLGSAGVHWWQANARTKLELELDTAKAKLDTADAQFQTCELANTTNLASINTLQYALSTCVGARDDNTKLQALAAQVAATAEGLARDERARRRAERESALSGSCRDNAAIAVCPALAGGKGAPQ